jgi:carbonic anhydrase
MKDGPFLRESKLWADALAYQSFSWSEGETERQVLDRSVVEDVQFLRRHPLIKPSIPITGWVFNQDTGEVEEIDCGLKDGLDLGQIQQLKDQFKTLPATAPSGLPLGKTAH